jgi:hypothetical protein
MDILRVKYRALIDENNGLSVKVQNMERERLEGDAAVSKMKETVSAQNSQGRNSTNSSMS